LEAEKEKEFPRKELRSLDETYSGKWRKTYQDLEDNAGRRVNVPIHSKEIGRGLLRKILYEKLRREI